MFAASGAGEMCAVGECEGVFRALASLSDCGGRGRVSVASLAVSGRLRGARVPRHEGRPFVASGAKCRGTDQFAWRRLRFGSSSWGTGTAARGALVSYLSRGVPRYGCLGGWDYLGMPFV